MANKHIVKTDYKQNAEHPVRRPVFLILWGYFIGLSYAIR
jgi:hypothetical protein